jgi:hypothetical protein
LSQTPLLKAMRTGRMWTLVAAHSLFHTHDPTRVIITVGAQIECLLTLAIRDFYEFETVYRTRFFLSVLSC